MDNFYELLAQSIDPALLNVAPVTTEQKTDAINSIKAKDNIADVSQSRKNERDWKAGQKKRSQLSKNSLLLNKAKEKPTTLGQRSSSLVNHPINTTNVSGNLLK